MKLVKSIIAAGLAFVGCAHAQENPQGKPVTVEEICKKLQPDIEQYNKEHPEEKLTVQCFTSSGPTVKYEDTLLPPILLTAAEKTRLKNARAASKVVNDRESAVERRIHHAHGVSYWKDNWPWPGGKGGACEPTYMIRVGDNYITGFKADQFMCKQVIDSDGKL